MSKVSTRPKKVATPVTNRANSSSQSVLPKDNPESIFYVLPGSEKKATPLSSPTLITLQIRAHEPAFTANNRTAADEAGFEWHGKIFKKALLDRDTGEQIAEIRLNGFEEATGGLKVIEILCDPEICAIEWNAGTRLMNAVERFASLMNGAVCDGVGHELSAEERTALANLIDAIMRKRAASNRPARVRQSDGTFKTCVGLSCQTQAFTARGKYLDYNPFDVPELEWYEGQKFGLELARQYFSFRKKHRTCHLDIASTIEAAMKSMGPEDYNGKTRGTVAHGFMQTMVEMLDFSAQHAAFDKFIDARVKKAEADRLWWENNRQEKALEFTARMKTAKAAKKARAQGGAA